MTTLTPFDITEALPGVEVRPLTDAEICAAVDALPDNAAMVLTGGEHGEMVLIHDYYKDATARPLICRTHGIQRFDWNEKTGKFECAKCPSRPTAGEKPRKEGNHVSRKDL